MLKCKYDIKVVVVVVIEELDDLVINALWNNSATVDTTRNLRITVKFVEDFSSLFCTELTFDAL
jgi:hypothetical protein